MWSNHERLQTPPSFSAQVFLQFVCGPAPALLVSECLDSDMKCLWEWRLLYLVTHHHDLSMWLFVWRSKDHPVGCGSKAVAHLLGIRDRHGGGLSIILQEHQLPGQTGHSLSLKPQSINYAVTVNNSKHSEHFDLYRGQSCWLVAEFIQLTIQIKNQKAFLFEEVQRM